MEMLFKLIVFLPLASALVAGLAGTLAFTRIGKSKFVEEEFHGHFEGPMWPSRLTTFFLVTAVPGRCLLTKELSSKGAKADKSALQCNDIFVKEKILTTVRGNIYLLRQVYIFSICIDFTRFPKRQVKTGKSSCKRVKAGRLVFECNTVFLLYI